jgi:hypothetical protein|tara:strand:+ start:149 stop:610 length:462 start_codon:yes stop_codon:yes gene_type:complete
MLYIRKNKNSTMNKILYTLLILSITLAGCKTEGCTDQDAVNWNADADTFDGSCLYEGQAVLWYGEEVATEKQQFATSYSFYSDGQLVGSQAVTMFWTASPDCGQQSSITITKDMGNNTSMSASYEVIDDQGYTVWEGIINFQANTCLSLELTL